MTTIREYFDTEQKALNAQRKWYLKSESSIEVGKEGSGIANKPYM